MIKQNSGQKSKFEKVWDFDEKRLHWVYGHITSQYFFFGLNDEHDHGLRTPIEGINRRNLKIFADVADKICFGRT